MIVYTLQRLAGAVPTLLVLLVLTFFLLRAAPGGPFDKEKAWPPEIQQNIMLYTSSLEAIQREVIIDRTCYKRINTTDAEFFHPFKAYCFRVY